MIGSNLDHGIYSNMMPVNEDEKSNRRDGEEKGRDEKGRRNEGAGRHVSKIW